MDDTTRLKAEFPLGKTLNIIVMEPTAGQGLVLALSRRPTEGDQKAQLRLLRRLFNVIENLITQDVWDNTVEPAVISEEITPNDLLEFVHQIITFPWADHRKPTADPQDVPFEEPAPDVERRVPHIVP